MHALLLPEACGVPAGPGLMATFLPRKEFSEGERDVAVSAVCALVLLLVHSCCSDLGEWKNLSECHKFSKCQLSH